MTVAPLRRVFPVTIARAPSMRMLAPIRMSSLACMNRFSKMSSVITEVPAAWVISAIYWACMSVANPGYSLVTTSAARRSSLPRTLMRPRPVVSMFTPVSRSFSVTLERWLGLQSINSSSPFVIAPVARNVPASIRSGIMRCVVPFNSLTPSIVMVGVPAPSTFAPILFNISARSTTSGSQATF